MFVPLQMYEKDLEAERAGMYGIYLNFDKQRTQYRKILQTYRIAVRGLLLSIDHILVARNVQASGVGCWNCFRCFGQC
jgi:hypothetical protein